MFNAQPIVAPYETFEAFQHDVLAILVVYGIPATDAASAFSKRLPGVQLFVYDNNPTADSNLSRGQGYEHDASNGGVSKAYNRGFEYARVRGIHWLLMADQDSALDEKYMETFWHTIRTSPSIRIAVPKMIDALGIASPFRWEHPYGKRLQHVNRTQDLKNYRFINSGLLIDVKLFEAAGGYDEQFPLDYADIAFGYRLSGVVDEFHVIDVAVNHQVGWPNGATPERALARFRLFCQGARRMGRIYNRQLLYGSYCLFRAIKFSWRFKSTRYLTIAFTDD